MNFVDSARTAMITTTRMTMSVAVGKSPEPQALIPSSVNGFS